MKIKRYRLAQLPFLAFFSKRVYADVGRNWKGVNLAYVFLLLAVCCVPITLHTREALLSSMETGQVDILNQLPEINIRYGEASADVKQPHYIRASNGDPIAIIDTTGSMNYIDDASVKVLLTETKLIVRRGRNLFNTFDLEGIDDLTINKHIINDWANAIKGSVAPLSYGIYLLLSYIFAVMALVFVAIVGLILAQLTKSPLSFKDSLRVATVAATPSIIFITIAGALGFGIPVYIYLAVTFLYLFAGVKSCGSTPDVATSGEDDQIDLKSFLHEDEAHAAEEAA